MANPEHLKILKQGVEVWNKWREGYCETSLDLSEADLKGANLTGANLRNVNISRADLRDANLRDANLREASLNGSNLQRSSLRKARLRGANMIGADLGRAYLSAVDLMQAKLSWANLGKANLLGSDLFDAVLRESNLENTDLRYCRLVEANISGARLTGARLYGTARDNWIINEVHCEYVCWDKSGERRCPKDRDLEPGEFERLYAALPTIEYIFQKGMSPLDPLIMDRIVQAIRERRPEFDIKIDSINARGLAPSIRFTVQREEHKEPALEAVRREYNGKIGQLESERDRLYQLVARAVDTPKEVKLITAGPGAIVATDGSTINIQQHIHNVLELQKAIVAEPEGSESFAKVAKKTALDIVGEALKDIAKGQVKEAAKQIVELGKDLGPIVAKTAAYAFFKGML